MGLAQPLQSGQLGVGTRLLQDEGVAGSQGLDLGVGQGGVAHVVHLPTGDIAAQDLMDERCLALDGLPAEHVEGTLGHIAGDGHLGVLVALTDGTALPLGDVGGPPRAVHVVQRAETALDVGAHPHLLGGADEHRHPPVTAAGEELGLGLVVAGLVDETDAPRRHPPRHQLVAEFAIHAPAAIGPGRAQVAEDDLQAPRRGDGCPDRSA